MSAKGKTKKADVRAIHSLVNGIGAEVACGQAAHRVDWTSGFRSVTCADCKRIRKAQRRELLPKPQPDMAERIWTALAALSAKSTSMCTCSGCKSDSLAAIREELSR